MKRVDTSLKCYSTQVFSFNSTHKPPHVHDTIQFAAYVGNSFSYFFTVLKFLGGEFCGSASEVFLFDWFLYQLCFDLYPVPVKLPAIKITRRTREWSHIDTLSGPKLLWTYLYFILYNYHILCFVALHEFSTMKPNSKITHHHKIALKWAAASSPASKSQRHCLIFLNTDLNHHFTFHQNSINPTPQILLQT